jgi:hypothetical protein
MSKTKQEYEADFKFYSRTIAEELNVKEIAEVLPVVAPDGRRVTRVYHLADDSVSYELTNLKDKER